MAFFGNYDMTDQTQLVIVLNRMYASEIIAAEQYYNHGVAVQGIYSLQLQDMFFEHADDERKHAGMLKDHIMVMGGVLDNQLTRMVMNNPTTDGRMDVQSSDVTSEMLNLDLTSEQTAIDAYTEIALAVKDTWPLTFTVVSAILADEYEHRHDLRNLLGPTECFCDDSQDDA
jgi:bacterioferritin